VYTNLRGVGDGLVFYFPACSAKIGGSSERKATLRLVIGGALAMAFTYGVGLLLGTTGIA
jgi:VIT1/CCC1 family predicted Fe2+/Mn2+ transporter